MRFFIILSAVVLLATASDRNSRQKSDWTRQIIRNNQNQNNPSSSSSESHEQLSNILKTKVYNPNRCILVPTPTSDEIELFHQWTAQHNKQYSTERERSCRMINVINTIRENHIHNQRFEEGKVSYKRGLNHLSDLTMQEVREQILMNNPQKLQVRRSSLGDLPELPEAREFVDYREEGLVGPVAQQGGCGSCYAWASAAVLEGQLRKCDIYREPVSVQNMVDCATDCAMCEGGLPYYVFEYQKRGGILPADKYPYLDRNGTCKFSKTDTIAYVDRNYGFNLESIRTRHEYIKKIVSTVGPVAVALLAEDSFKDYESGIYDINNCGNEINHAVTIVGYGTDSRHGDYWLIKNSWGKYWGEKGYGRLAMGKNLCQIENIVMFAQVRDTKGKVCQLFDF